MTATTPPQVLESLDWAKCQTQFPAAVIYKTHKGRGVSFMEDNAHWHGAVVDDQTYAKARTELVETLGKLEAGAMTANSVAMREAFGEALLALATDHPEMVVLDADVATSTRTAPFGKAYPDRFFNMGVAEANMTDVAAGMATCGLRPIVEHIRDFPRSESYRPDTQHHLL